MSFRDFLTLVDRKDTFFATGVFRFCIFGMCLLYVWMLRKYVKTVFQCKDSIKILFLYSILEKNLHIDRILMRSNSLYTDIYHLFKIKNLNNWGSGTVYPVSDSQNKHHGSALVPWARGIRYFEDKKSSYYGKGGSIIFRVLGKWF